MALRQQTRRRPGRHSPHTMPSVEVYGSFAFGHFLFLGFCARLHVLLQRIWNIATVRLYAWFDAPLPRLWRADQDAWHALVSGSSPPFVKPWLCSHHKDGLQDSDRRYTWTWRISAATDRGFWQQRTSGRRFACFGQTITSRFYSLPCGPFKRRQDMGWRHCMPCVDHTVRCSCQTIIPGMADGVGQNSRPGQPTGAGVRFGDTTTTTGYLHLRCVYKLYNWTDMNHLTQAPVE